MEEVASLGLHGAEEELLPCPICFKTCNSRLELDAHMDTHPDTALRYTHTLSKIQMKMMEGEEEKVNKSRKRKKGL